MTKSLEMMCGEVYTNNVEHGWFDESRTFGEDIALLHSEVSEMFEAYRTYGIYDATGPNKKVLGIELSEPPKPEGVGSEAADILIRLLDTCQRHGISLQYEYERKMEYNKTRPYKHGGKKI